MAKRAGYQVIGLPNYVVWHIDTDENNAEVFVKFANVESGLKALRGLNGRHFGGNMISANPVTEALYNAQWPRAMKV